MKHSWIDEVIALLIMTRIVAQNPRKKAVKYSSRVQCARDAAFIDVPFSQYSQKVLIKTIDSTPVEECSLVSQTELTPHRHVLLDSCLRHDDVVNFEYHSAQLRRQ